LSVNLHLKLEVKKYEESQKQRIIEVLKRVIKEEGLEAEFQPAEYKKDKEGNDMISIQSNPRYPVIISRSYLWIPQMQQRFQSALAESIQGQFHVFFDGEDADS
jgi:hypothetical protein